MTKWNKTQVTGLFLCGFTHIQSWTTFIFTVLLLIYVVIVFGNSLIVVMVSVSPRLQSPMYLFLRNLSLCEILFTTNIVPKMLEVIVQNGSSISFSCCASQLYIFTATGIEECLLLTAMSYDRYLAISKPLHYSSIMNFKHYLYLVISSWLCSVMLPAITITLICLLDFCRSKVIDHFFCDLAPLLELSCSDTSIVEFEVFAQTIPVLMFSGIYIVWTYANIFLAIFKISSAAGQQKAFSTCSSHLTVVCTYYGTMITLYGTPSSRHSLKVNKILSLMYTVETPLINPIIYSLRTQELQKVLQSMLWKFQK